MNSKNLNQIFFAAFTVLSLLFANAAIAQSYIDRLLYTQGLAGQIDGYYKLVQISVRELGELDDLLKHTDAEPDAAIRKIKVTAVKLKIADEQARLAFRQDQLQRAEKLYGHGTARAREAKLLRLGGSSLKALPAIGLGAGVIFAGSETPALRAVSVNDNGPVPVRLEKSNIGNSDFPELENFGSESLASTATQSAGRSNSSAKIHSTK